MKFLGKIRGFTENLCNFDRTLLEPDATIGLVTLVKDIIILDLIDYPALEWLVIYFTCAKSAFY